MKSEESRLHIDSGFALDDYAYQLPENLIAQSPATSRDQSRLLVVSRAKSEIKSSKFTDLLQHIPEKSLIIANNSSVVPGRIRTRSADGSAKEMLILSPLDLLQQSTIQHGTTFTVTATALLRPSKKVQLGQVIAFGELEVQVLEKKSFGQCLVRLTWKDQDLESILRQIGEMPLPPYIRRLPEKMDTERYQTVYASHTEKGSIAAPTAGLHFTNQMREQLLDAGHFWAEVTLYVGYGTFSPIRCSDIRDHQMHSEYVKVREETVEMVRKAKKDRRTIIAVGTTSMRTLEGVTALKGHIQPFTGWLDTYISPGFQFKIVDGLITNFHLPKSSLLVLISAFAGREKILAAYRRAIEEKYRFFSYGDAMLIAP